MITLSQDKAQPVHAPDILVAGGSQVNPGGFYAGVAQHIRQLHHVPANLVERLGEEVAQMVSISRASRSLPRT